MRTRIERLWPLLALALIVAIVLLSFPYLASAYYLEAGGRALDDPERAEQLLNNAIEWDANNGQAYRVLAGICREQGDWAAAVRALTRYTEMRPNNPLGYMELAQTYQEIEEIMASLPRVDLLSLLPQAEVQAPQVPIDTPYGGPGSPAWQSYVAETTFSLPPDYGDRPTLFMHSPSRVIYTLSLPEQPMVLRIDQGMDPQTYNLPGDGVTFEVSVDGEQIFLEHLDKASARAGWHERTIDLAPWAGTEIALSLAVTPGSVADASGDSAGWGEPHLVDAQWPQMEALKPTERLLDAWGKAGMTADNFILWGEAARQEGQFDDALRWYWRAIAWEPGLGDPWHYMGQIGEAQGEWIQALEAYERAGAEADLHTVSRSSPFYRMGMIYHLRLAPPQPEKAREMYAKALERGDFASVSEEAWTHARLGQVYYTLGREVLRAENEILDALRLLPDDKWLYVVLGDLYRAEGRLTEAADAYEEALRLLPSFEAAQKRLEALDN